MCVMAIGTVKTSLMRIQMFASARKKTSSVRGNIICICLILSQFLSASLSMIMCINESSNCLTERGILLVLFLLFTVIICINSVIRVRTKITLIDNRMAHGAFSFITTTLNNSGLLYIGAHSLPLRIQTESVLKRANIFQHTMWLHHERWS